MSETSPRCECLTWNHDWLLSSSTVEFLYFSAHLKRLAWFPSWGAVKKRLLVLWDRYMTAFSPQDVFKHALLFCFVLFCFVFLQILCLWWSCFSILQQTELDVFIFWSTVWKVPCTHCPLSSFWSRHDLTHIDAAVGWIVTPVSFSPQHTPTHAPKSFTLHSCLCIYQTNEIQCVKQLSLELVSYARLTTSWFQPHTDVCEMMGVHNPIISFTEGFTVPVRLNFLIYFVHIRWLTGFTLCRLAERA